MRSILIPTRPTVWSGFYGIPEGSEFSSIFGTKSSGVMQRHGVVRVGMGRRLIG